MEELDCNQPLADLLLEEKGIHIGVIVVDQLLNKYYFRRRKAVKTKATGGTSNRN